MGRTCAIYLLLGLLGPAAGCQLISRENLASGTRAADSGTGGHELPPKAAAEVCRATAELLEKDGKDKDAIALYEKARKNDPANTHIARRLAVLYDRKKDYNRALDEYKHLLQRFPKDADLLSDIGYSYYNQGNWAEAEKYLRQAIAVNAHHARAWINLGMTLAQNHHKEESLEAFAQIVSPAQALCNLAFILTTQGKFEDAKAAYRQALNKEPDLPLARGALARLEHAGVPSPSARVPDAAPRIDDVRALEQTPIEVPRP